MTVKVGEIGVDAGLCWIGDPCYLTSGSAELFDWKEFCNIVNKNHENGQPYHEFDDGVCVNSGHGDGVYPVYADIEDGIVKKAWVEFVSDEEDEEYEEPEEWGHHS